MPWGATIWEPARPPPGVATCPRLHIGRATTQCGHAVHVRVALMKKQNRWCASLLCAFCSAQLWAASPLQLHTAHACLSISTRCVHRANDHYAHLGAPRAWMLQTELLFSTLQVHDTIDMTQHASARPPA